MMASNPVAAKEGGMKDYGECCGIFVERCFLRWKGGKVKWWKGSPETSPPSYLLCHPGQACLTRDPVF